MYLTRRPARHETFEIMAVILVAGDDADQIRTDLERF